VTVSRRLFRFHGVIGEVRRYGYDPRPVLLVIGMTSVELALGILKNVDPEHYIGSSGRIRTYDQSVNPDDVGTLPLRCSSGAQQTLANDLGRFPRFYFALTAHSTRAIRVFFRPH
jgi:hypothetical protein